MKLKLSVISTVVSLLSQRDKRNLLLLLGAVIATAFTEKLGVVSILPFITLE